MSVNEAKMILTVAQSSGHIDACPVLRAQGCLCHKNPDDLDCFRCKLELYPNLNPKRLRIVTKHKYSFSVWDVLDFFHISPGCMALISTLAYPPPLRYGHLVKIVNGKAKLTNQL